MLIFAEQATKKASVSKIRDESLNFRGTTPIGKSMPAFGISSAVLSECRLSGNGEDTRSRLTRQSRFNGSTQGPVTSPPPALPRSTRQLSEAFRGDFFPVIVSVLFSVGGYFTGSSVICQSCFFIFYNSASFSVTNDRCNVKYAHSHRKNRTGIRFGVYLSSARHTIAKTEKGCPI